MEIGAEMAIGGVRAVGRDLKMAEGMGRVELNEDLWNILGFDCVFFG